MRYNHRIKYCERFLVILVRKNKQKKNGKSSRLTAGKVTGLMARRNHVICIFNSTN